MRTLTTLAPFAFALLFSACSNSGATFVDAATDLTSTSDLSAIPDLSSLPDQSQPLDLFSAATDGSDCRGACVANHPAAYQKFIGYALKECGCTTGAACASMCTGDCAAMMLSDNDPCSNCLLNEAQKGTGSACTTKAAISDCLPDSTCSPFIQCEISCP